ncbi:MAG TPA: thioredoxin domain-containing protein, partial [Longimicrobiaceae bacterium]|nr:thioredoxin domain-containing protein [Longimicrobiaceae bacterium]
MTRGGRARRAGLTPVALAGMLAVLAAVSACAQSGGQRAEAAAPAEVDSILPRADRGRYKGAEAAPVTVVEVSDFQCPFCRQWFEETYRQLDSVYVRTGRVRMVFINYP